MRHPDGSEYIGSFYNGMYHGQGALRLENGKVLEGQFERDIFLGGKSTLYFDDESSF